MDKVSSLSLQTDYLENRSVIEPVSLDTSLETHHHVRFSAFLASLPLSLTPASWDFRSPQAGPSRAVAKDIPVGRGVSSTFDCFLCVDRRVAGSVDVHGIPGSGESTDWLARVPEGTD